MADRRRRQLIAGLAGAAIAAPFAWRAWRAPNANPHAAHGGHAAMASSPSAPTFAPAAFDRPLRMPGADGLMADMRLDAPLRLTARAGAFDVFGTPRTQVLHYAAEVDGRMLANPVLHATRGDRIDVALRNALDMPTTLHWHGLEVDEGNDGGGLHPVAPRGDARSAFELRNRAGLYWYHAHPHGRTGRQLHAGLAGLLVVDDDEERALRDALKLDWGIRDVPLLIADKQVDARHALRYRDGADDWIGNRVLVNWTPEPHLDVAPALHRFRIANACNARLLRPAFMHGDRALPMQLIGTDGGLLASPQAVDALFLAPAQRIDVLVDLCDVPLGERVRLRSLEYLAMEQEDESGAFVRDPMADHPGAVPMGDALDLMELRIGGGSTALCASIRTRVPDTLSSLPPPPDTRGWPVRELRLHMDAEGTWLIGDTNMHRDGMDPAFTVKRGTREVWELRNAMSSMPHPLHLHGFQARVVSRSISPPDVRAMAVAPNGLGPQDLGMTDTVLVWPGEIVRLAIDFSQPYRGTQRYMLHCHNLEHEDMGMMLVFAVVD